jgi:NAD(P) transhydrogenase
MSDRKSHEESHYDLIAIGAGPAGESATELASFFGFRCLVIEKDRPGGLVTTMGGAPTKTLREAALYFTGFRDRSTYGIGIESPPEIILDAIRKRTWTVCENLQRLTADHFRMRGIDYLHGRGRLESNRSVVVETADGGLRKIHGRIILIATGSNPALPDCSLPFNHPGICTSDTILKRGHPPQVLLIVGGGPVAVEFATIARALGIVVTIVSNGSRLLTTMDSQLSSLLAAMMKGWGVKFIQGATIQAATPRNDQLEVTLTTGESLMVDTILFAAGRIGNTKDLGLEEAGIVCDERGRIPVDTNFRTSVERVYAAGDVIGPSLASVAMEQGRAAVCHAFNLPVEGLLDPVPVSAVYGMPELARVGLTEDECVAQDLDYEVGCSDLGDTARGAISGRGGMLKLVFLKDSRKLVGVHCLGDIASELIGIGQMAIRCRATIHTISSMTLNTPTYTYAYKYAAFDGLRRLAAQGVLKGRRVVPGSDRSFDSHFNEERAP